jgi:hypothetical protein
MPSVRFSSSLKIVFESNYFRLNTSARFPLKSSSDHRHPSSYRRKDYVTIKTPIAAQWCAFPELYRSSFLHSEE